MLLEIQITALEWNLDQIFLILHLCLNGGVTLLHMTD